MTAKERKGKGSPPPLGDRIQMKEMGSVGVSRKLLLLLGAFAVGLFAWWSRGLCEMALSLWGASSPVPGAVVVCFWLLCLTALVGASLSWLAGLQDVLGVMPANTKALWTS